MYNFVKKLFSLRLLALIFLFVSHHLSAATYTYRFENILVASDPSRSLDPLSEDVPHFSALPDHQIHAPYSEGFIWLKGVLPKEAVRAPYLVLTSPLSGKLTLYVRNDRGEWQAQGISGSALEWDKRESPSYFGAFKLRENFVGREFLIKREGHHLLDASLLLMDESQFRKINTRRSNALLFYAGAAFALLVYNLFLFSYCRERIYGVYSAFILVLLGTAMNVTGGLDYLISGPIVPSEYLMLFSSASVFFAIVFSRKFVEFAKFAPGFDRWSLRLLILPVTIFFTYLFFNSSITVRAKLGYAIDFTIVGVLIFLIVASIVAHRRGSPMAKFYLLSWVVLVIGVFIYVAGVHGLIQNSFYSQWGVLLGNLCEMLLLSLALAYRMSIIQAEKAEMEVRARDKERYQRLVRVLCHDISNPLSVVKNYATLMERKADSSPERLKPMAQKISRASSIIEDLIFRVRNFEALEHEQSLNLKPVNLGETIAEASFLVAQKIEAKNISLKYTPEELNHAVMAEKTSLLANVVMNALSNAIKFSDTGGTIEIKARPLGDLIELCITDHGLGMGQAQLENFRLRGEVEVKQGTRGEKGSGLGMNLMRSYMGLYGGSVVIASEPRSDESRSSGTSVFLTFKRASASDLQ